MHILRKTLLFSVVVATVVLSGCIVNRLPRAAFTATPAFGYPPLEVTFNATASSSPNGPIVNYEWDFGGSDTEVGPTVSHTYTEKGVYAVTLEVADSTGKRATRTMSVEALNRAPIARFTTNVSTTGVNQPVWFDASTSTDSDGEIVDYLWDFGDGETGDGAVVEHTYTTAQGRGWRPVITLTVIDENGAPNSITHTILVVGCDACNP
jgi:PKD repeat protein